jgi:hypothetical protein
MQAERGLVFFSIGRLATRAGLSEMGRLKVCFQYIMQMVKNLFIQFTKKAALYQ